MALFFKKKLGLVQCLKSFNAVLIIASHSFSLSTPPYRISLQFSSGDFPFPHSHSMKSQWHSNPYIKSGSMSQAQANLHMCS